MSRRRRPEKKELSPDPKWGSVLVTRFVNCILRKGKRSRAERILYSALDIIERETDQNGLEVFQKAVENVKPAIEVRSRRVGGQTYQIPTELSPDRKTALSIRWLITYAKERPEKTMVERLAAELMGASKGEGASMRRREEIHRMAEANRAFAHYRL